MALRSFARYASSCSLAASLVIAGLPVSVALAAPGDPTEAPVADAPTAAILPLTVDGALPPADLDRLTEELVEGLGRGAFGVVEPGTVANATSAAGGCATPACAKKVAAAVGASHVVRTVVKVADRDYEVSVTLIDGKTGQTLANTEDNCEICGVVEAGAMLSTAAATLKTKLDALAAGPSTLGVGSDPAGAEIRIDGELVGATPFEGPVIPGKHVLRVSKDGFITVEREVTFVEGVAETLAFDLDKVPSKLPSRPYGYVSVALGVAGIGAAVTFAVLDDRSIRIGNRCKADNVDAEGNCRQLYDLDYFVLGSALAGAALTTLGVAILINSSNRKRGGKKNKADARTSARVRSGRSARRQRRPRVGVGAGSVTLSGRF